MLVAIIVSSFLVGIYCNYYVHRILKIECEFIQYVDEQAKKPTSIFTYFMFPLPYIIAATCGILYLKEGMTSTFLFESIFITIMISLAYLDKKTSFVYVRPLIVGTAITILSLLFQPDLITNHFIGAMICYAIVYGVSKLTNGFAEGDYLVAGYIGLNVGLVGGLISLWISIVIGGLHVSFKYFKKQLLITDEVPFVPYLAVGAFISLMVEELVLDYVQYIVG